LERDNRASKLFLAVDFKKTTDSYSAGYFEETDSFSAIDFEATY
jgi:hypothetical protein